MPQEVQLERWIVSGKSGLISGCQFSGVDELKEQTLLGLIATLFPRAGISD